MIDPVALVLVLLITIILPIILWVLTVCKFMKLRKIKPEKSEPMALLVWCLILISLAITVGSIYYWNGLIQNGIWR